MSVGATAFGFFAVQWQLCCTQGTGAKRLLQTTSISKKRASCACYKPISNIKLSKNHINQALAAIKTKKHSL
jgi:hypothetical protein